MAHEIIIMKDNCYYFEVGKEKKVGAKVKYEEDWSQIRVPKCSYQTRIAGMIGIVFIIIAYHFNSVANASLMPAMATEIGGMEVYPLAIAIMSCVQAALVPLFGSMAKTRDKGKLFKIGCVIYALACVAAAFSPNMWVHIGIRIVMGVGASMLSALFFLVIGDLWDDRLRPGKQAWFSLFVGISLLVGSTLTGILLDFIGWRAVFLIQYLPLFVVGIIVMQMFLPKYPPEISKEEASRFDVPGAIFMTLAVIGLCVVLSFQGSFLLWNQPTIWCILAVTVVCFIIFIIVENKTVKKGNTALIPLSIFKSRGVFPFLGGLLCCISGMGIMAYAPRAFIYCFGLSATQAGLFGSIGYLPQIILAGFLGAWLGRNPKKRLKPFFCLTLLATAIPVGMIAYLRPEGSVLGTSGAAVFVILYILNGIASTVTSFGFNAAVNYILPQKMWTDGNTIVRLAFMLGSSIGTAIVGGMVSSVENFAVGYRSACVFIIIVVILTFICGMMCKESKYRLEQE